MLDPPQAITAAKILVCYQHCSDINAKLNPVLAAIKRKLPGRSVPNVPGVSILGSVTNNTDEKTECIPSKSADDTKLRGVADTPESSDAVQ